MSSSSPSLCRVAAVPRDGWFFIKWYSICDDDDVANDDYDDDEKDDDEDDNNACVDDDAANDGDDHATLSDVREREMEL